MSLLLMDQDTLKAFTFAYRAHASQMRKGTDVPFLIHPLRVGWILHNAMASKDAVIAGLLHHIFDDPQHFSNEFENSLPVEDEILFHFGEEIANHIEGATERNRDDSWEERKTHMIQFVSGNIDPDVAAVICADKLDNILSIEEVYKEYENTNADEFWSRFNRGMDDQAWYFTSLAAAFANHLGQSRTLNVLIPRFQDHVGLVFG